MTRLQSLKNLLLLIEEEGEESSDDGLLSFISSLVGSSERGNIKTQKPEGDGCFCVVEFPGDKSAKILHQEEDGVHYVVFQGEGDPQRIEVEDTILRDDGTVDPSQLPRSFLQHLMHSMGDVGKEFK